MVLLRQVSEQDWGASDRNCGDIDLAVVVIVRCRRPTIGIVRHCWKTVAAAEPAGLVPEHEKRLIVLSGHLVNPRIDVAVRKPEVLLPIIVHVSKSGSPSQIGLGCCSQS